MIRIRQRLVLWISILSALLLLTILLFHCMAVRITAFTEAGGCVAVVFDKHKVLQADRIVLREGDKTVTITDPQQVQELASTFVVANRSALCGYYMDRWMDIYCGDTVVRQIHWNDHEELVTVYESDAGHWVLLSGTDNPKGQIMLSDETVQTIQRLLQE